MKSISIVIPTHNRAHILARALASVLTDASDDLEVVVVDDASTDDTAEVIRHIGDPRIRYERLDAKANANVARNRGAALACAPVLAFLDSDDAYLPGRPERLVRLFAENPEVDAVLDGFSVNVRGRTRMAKQDRAVLTGSDLIELLVTHRMPLTCSALAVRRGAFEQVGGFDPSLDRQQDRDLLLRLSRTSRVACGFASDVIKHQGRDSLSRNPTGYIRGLDALVHRHPVFLEERYRDLLGYLACRMILKAAFSGRFGEAKREVDVLRSSRHLPRRFISCLVSYPRGRRQRMAP